MLGKTFEKKSKQHTGLGLARKVAVLLLVSALLPLGAFAAANTAEPAEKPGNHMTVAGTVTEITPNKEGISITISNDQMGMVFHIKPGIFIVDRKDNQLKNPDAIQKGMVITAILPKDVPMTMSLPPQTSGAVALVLNSNVGTTTLAVFDKNFVDMANTLQLKADAGVQILDVWGTKRKFTAEDIQNAECLVLYTSSTRSIPAQTVPEMVIQVSTAEMLREATVAEKPVTYVQLRKEAEAKGYHIQWQSATKPIILTKDDVRIEILLGNDSLKVTHKTRDIKPIDRLTKLDLPAKLVQNRTMVPSSLIDAL